MTKTILQQFISRRKLLTPIQLERLYRNFKKEIQRLNGIRSKTGGISIIAVRSRINIDKEVQYLRKVIKHVSKEQDRRYKVKFGKEAPKRKLP